MNGFILFSYLIYKNIFNGYVYLKGKVSYDFHSPFTNQVRVNSERQYMS